MCDINKYSIDSIYLLIYIHHNSLYIVIDEPHHPDLDSCQSSNTTRQIESDTGDFYCAFTTAGASKSSTSAQNGPQYIR